jgi:hypothetical protein
MKYYRRPLILLFTIAAATWGLRYAAHPVQTSSKDFFLLVLVLLPIFVGIEYLHQSRIAAMRALATRWSFQYSSGDPQIWAGRRSPVHYPLGFKMRCYPVCDMSKLWNVIDGEMNGIRVLIFDTKLGTGRGARYCTFFAIQTSENLFKCISSREKIAQRAGWTAVYRIPFIRIRPWTISITRIEELLNNL